MGAAAKAEASKAVARAAKVVALEVVNLFADSFKLGPVRTAITADSLTKKVVEEATAAASEVATLAAVLKAKRVEEKEIAREAVKEVTKVTKSAGSSSRQEHAAMVTTAGLSTRRYDSSLHPRRS